MPNLRDRATFAEHASPETVRAHLDDARRRASEAIRDVQWLEALYAEKTAHLPPTHACTSCSGDGMRQGTGCQNCRYTGMDQTPCQAEGHQPSCPAGCCDQPKAGA